MACCHYAAPSEDGDSASSVDISAITYGPGVLAEVGDHAPARGVTRAALFTDKGVAALEHVSIVRDSLAAAGVDVAYPRRRLLDNAPLEVSREALAELFGGALSYW